MTKPSETFDMMDMKEETNHVERIVEKDSKLVAIAEELEWARGLNTEEFEIAQKQLLRKVCLSSGDD
jgi:hypothetical protein